MSGQQSQQQHHNHQHAVLDPRLGAMSSPVPAPPQQSRHRLPSLQSLQQHQQQHQQPQPSHSPSSLAGAQVGSESAANGATAYAAAQQSPPQPYYRYPSPRVHTPTHASAGSSGAGGGAGVGGGSGGGQSSASHSNQASPHDDDAGAYAGDNAASPAQGDDGQGGADDPKRPRACEACRGLKVRCDQDPAHPEIPCKRCAKAGRQCLVTQPSRKRQKKADSRVAELEKKLDALTAALHHQRQDSSFPAPQRAPPAADMSGRGSMNAPTQLPYDPSPINHSAFAPPDPLRPPSDQKRKRSYEDDLQETPSVDGAGEVVNPMLSNHAASVPSPADDPSTRLRDLFMPAPEMKHSPTYRDPDEFARRINSLVDPELASTIFNRYVIQLAPRLPAVVFPPGTTAEHVFKQKPILYVCILSATSHGTLHPEASREIGTEAVGAIADCVVRRGAKSLELIQAMQVLALWYRPPERAEATNFYQLVHMAAVMALDIGLGKRFNPSKARRGFGGPNANFAPGPHKTLPQDSDTLEARRAWLCCYYLCASASMVLRRPNLIRWTNYMKECIDILETHPDATALDKLFCQHIKIQHICEDIGLQFLMDDSTASISITDPKVTYALNVLEGQLKKWRENIPPELYTTGLKFSEHVTSLYLHEIALHFNHNIDDFRLPFTEESLKSVNNTSDTFTQNQMAALEACLKASHGILDTIMSFEVSEIKTLPMLIYFVRCVYAVVILIKMHVAVTTPNSELGKMMKAEDLKVDQYLDSLIRLFASVAKEEENKPHSKIVRILNVLRDWFSKHRDNAAVQTKVEQAPPPAAQDKNNQYSNSQTPLHLLSEVATGDQQQLSSSSSSAARQATPASDAPDWTFTNPAMMSYHRKASFAPDDTARQQQPQRLNQQPPRLAADGQEQPQPGNNVGFPVATGAASSDLSTLDLSNQEFAFGTGFEQAMDLAMGGMDGLQGGGLDNWFLGESIAPFGAPAYVGDSGQGGQW